MINWVISFSFVVVSAVHPCCLKCCPLCLNWTLSSEEHFFLWFHVEDMGKLLHLESLPLWKYTLPLPDVYQKRVTYQEKRYMCVCISICICVNCLCNMPQPLIRICTSVVFTGQFGLADVIVSVISYVACRVLPSLFQSLKILEQHTVQMYVNQEGGYSEWIK